jgi:hypothetical protein
MPGALFLSAKHYTTGHGCVRVNPMRSDARRPASEPVFAAMGMAFWDHAATPQIDAMRQVFLKSIAARGRVDSRRAHSIASGSVI